MPDNSMRTIPYVSCEEDLDDFIVRRSNFIRLYCEGKQYESCKNSPCRYASLDGCRHPLHPKNSERYKKCQD